MQPVQDDEGPVEVRLLSENDQLPKNSTIDPNRRSVLVNNRFSRSYNTAELNLKAVEDYRHRSQKLEATWYTGNDRLEEKSTGGLKWSEKPLPGRPVYLPHPRNLRPSMV